MSDYINREAAIEKIRVAAGCAECAGSSSALCVCNVCDVYNAIRLVKSLPAADVEPVRHGRWVRPHWRNSSYCCDCSECGGEAMHREYQWNKKGIYPICPSCGAKMNLEE